MTQQQEQNRVMLSTLSVQLAFRGKLALAARKARRYVRGMQRAQGRQAVCKHRAFSR